MQECSWTFPGKMASDLKQSELGGGLGGDKKVKINKDAKRHIILALQAWCLCCVCWGIIGELDSIFKRRDFTLLIKVHLVKAMVFPVVMYGSETWTVKKAECRRIDAFELWCWRRLLRVPWTARRSNQSILREITLGFLWKE